MAALVMPEWVSLNGDEWMLPCEVAPLVKVTPKTLANWRALGTGPSFIKLSPGRGGRIRYRRGDVLDWLAGEREAQAV